jgi:transposase
VSSRRSLVEGLSQSGRTFEASPNGGGRRMASQRWVEPTEEWAKLELLLEWPEQVEYERIRSAAIFGSSVAERSRQIGTPETTLRRRITSFKSHGMRGLFEPEQFEKSRLGPEVQGLILNLKSDYPPMRDNEIATICYVCFGQRPHGRSVRRVLEANPTAIRMFRRFKPYHEIEDVIERRLAIVTLHSEGWNVKSIAGYLKTSRPTVYRTLDQWIAENVYSLEYKPRGAKSKVDLRAMNEVRKLQENPELGEFRISAALAQLGIHLSSRTCGRILAVNRKLYGLEKPKRGSKEKKEMPFQSGRRHEIWSVDVRYLDHHLPNTGKVYSISILDNHSRALLASAVSTTQDLTAYLSVLYTAVERYGAPEVLVSDGASIFKANQAKRIYRSLGISKETIEKRKPWQNYVETTFKIQKRMADYYFARAESWEELVAAHDRWVEQYNTQMHWAHRQRKDGRRGPAEVLGFLTSVRHRPEDLERAFFSTRFTRVLDSLGYARIRHWKIYAEEGLAKREVALWLGSEVLTVEYAGEPLARYDVEYSPRTKNLRKVKKPQLFKTSHRVSVAQLRLFELEALGEIGWLKALRLDEYSPRSPWRSQVLQQTLFACSEAPQQSSLR